MGGSAGFAGEEGSAGLTGCAIGPVGVVGQGGTDVTFEAVCGGVVAAEREGAVEDERGGRDADWREGDGREPKKSAMERCFLRWVGNADRRSG